MSRRILFVLALVLGLAPVLSAAGLKAIAVTVDKPAKVSRDGVTYKTLKKGMPLYGGDVLRTGETGRVIIRFVDGSQAAVASNTDVALRRLTPQEDPVKTTLSLLRGSLRALVKKLGARSSFEVETYNTVVAVKGTDFEVGVVADKDGHKKTVAACFETQGKGLEVSGLDGKDPVVVGAGQQTSNNTGKPEKPSVLSAKDLQKALDKYRGLTPLNGAQTTPVAGMTGVTGAPAPTPSAAEQAAEQAFNAAARQAEGALGNYLQAMDSGDLDAQAAAQSQLSGLRDAAEALESQLTQREADLEAQIQQQTEAAHGDATQVDPLIQAQLQEVQQMQDTLHEVAQQSRLEQQADAAQGNLLMDRNGYRVQYNALVLRPAANIIQNVAISQRSAGPNSGRTEFQHLVTFNQDLPADWIPVYQRTLNDPLNLSGGSPNYWRTEDVVKTFNPSGDCVCMHVDLSDPAPVGTGVFGQARHEWYQAVGAGGGLAQGQQSFDEFGALTGINDPLQITASDLGNGILRMTYENLGGGPSSYTGTIFTVDVALFNPTALQNTFNLGSNLYELSQADLSSLGGSNIYELRFESPAYPGHEILPLLDTASFKDAFNQGWR